MSFCRWSSDFYRSDLYVYESDRGFESHVAGRRIKADPPSEVLEMPEESVEEQVAKMIAGDRWYASLKDSIGEIPEGMWLDLSDVGAEAGESYCDKTAGGCAARLRSLRAKGFNVPDGVIEALEEEA